jgi:O-antigen ligase
MSQLAEFPGSAPTLTEPRRDRVTILWIFLGLFIVGAATVSPLQGWNYIVKGLGFVLAFAYLIELIRGGTHVATETILFIAWLTWCLTGVFEQASYILFREAWITAFQIWVLLVIVAGFTDSRRALSLNLAAFLLAAFILGAYSYATGDYHAAETYGEFARLSGLAMNANTFGWIMLLAVVALAYFWMLPTWAKWFKYGILLIGFAAAGASEILTESRKGVLGMAFFFLVWIWLCYRKTLKRNVLILLVVIGLLVLGGYLGWQFTEQSGTGHRFQEVLDTFSGRTTIGSTYSRLEFYRLGWKMFLDNPLTGVGLNGFRVRTHLGDVSHSEYVEIGAGTGLPGFILYFSILWVLWRRCGKLAKYSDSVYVVQVANLTRAVILTILALDLGRWNFSDKMYWIIVGSFIGFTSAAWRDLRHRIASQPAEARAGGPTPGLPATPSPGGLGAPVRAGLGPFH